MKLIEWAHEIRSAVGLEPDEILQDVERRREGRRDVGGQEIVVRQRKALGILRLRNLSSNGGCGITEMPLAVGSLVFLQLKKPLFHAAEIRWTRSLSIGLEFLRPIRPDIVERLREEAPIRKAGARKRRASR